MAFFYQRASLEGTRPADNMQGSSHLPKSCERGAKQANHPSNRSTNIFFFFLSFC